MGLVFTTDEWRNTHWIIENYHKFTDEFNLELSSSIGGIENLKYCNRHSVSPSENKIFYLATDKIWFSLFVEDHEGNRYWNNNGGWNYEIKIVSSISYLRDKQPDLIKIYNTGWQVT